MWIAMVAIAKCVVLTVVCSFFFAPNVFAQGYLESDATRVKNLDRERNDGTGSFTGAIVTVPGEVVPKANFQVCNKSEHYAIAVAYFEESERGSRVRGWQNISKGKCETIARNVEYGKIYAKLGEITWSGDNLLWDGEDEWVGPHAHCVDPHRGFSVDANRSICPAGFKKVNFMYVNVGFAGKSRDGTYALNLRD